MVLAGRDLNWIFAVGDKIQDEDRDLTITDKKITYLKYNKNGKEYIQRNQYYICRCNQCGYEGEKSLSNLKKGVGCAVCTGRIVQKGVNDISTLRPDLLKYFVNINDAYNHTVNSSKRVRCRCPICNKEKDIIIANLSRNGFVCNYCSDGISYPEKFMTALLSQLNVNYERQFKIDKYRYDFYLPNYNVVIETHGEQHYTNTFMNKELIKEKQNDKTKRELANKKGLIYVEIDCRKSEITYIRNSILNNNFFASNFNLSIIDWDKCNIFALKNKLIEICEFWKNNSNDYTVDEVSIKFKLAHNTVLKYLHIGNVIGLCHFDKKEENKKYGERRNGQNNPNYGKKLSEAKKQELLMYAIKNGNKKAKRVDQFSLNGDFIKTFESINSIRKQLNYNTYSITECCNHNRKTAYGYKWEWNITLRWD